MNDYKAYLQQLKDEVLIEEVVSELTGFQLRGGGKHRTPPKGAKEGGLVVNVDEQVYFWNGRARGGDVIEFLDTEQGMGFDGAVRWLRDRTGLRYKESAGARVAYQARREKWDALTVIAKFMADKLQNSANATAKEYARGRGWSDETIADAGIGYWHWDLKEDLRKHLQMHQIDVERPEAVAILGFVGNVGAWGSKWKVKVDAEWLKKGKIPGAPPNLLVYPHYEGGKATYLAGRRLDWKPEDDWGKSWNLRAALVGSRQPYWNNKLNRRVNYVVVVEGQADAVTLQQWDVPAVALAGTYGDADFVERLKKHGRIYIAMDSDAAGNASTVKLGELVGPLAHVVTWTSGDANDWLKSGASADDCKALLGESPKFVMHQAARVATADGMERDELTHDVLRLAARLEPMQYSLFVVDIAKALGITQGQLNKAVKAAWAEMQTEAAQLAKRKPIAHEPNENGLIEQTVLLGEAADHEGHAQALWKLSQGMYAFSPKWGWLAHNGKMWEVENGEQVVNRGITSLLRKRMGAAVVSERDDLQKVCRANHTQVMGTRKQLESIAVVSTDLFDNDPHLLNCQNGVVDLRTGELLPHSPAQRFTYCINSDYVAGANDNEWVKFLAGVVGGGLENQLAMLEWFQEVWGYTLTGLRGERMLMYVYGPTTSGKGVMMETMMHLLGKPLGQTVNFKTFTSERQGDNQNFDLAVMAPARLVWADESRRHGRVNETMMKTMTGGGEIFCAHKGKPHFSYMPRFSPPWMTSNHPLLMDPDDDAAWMRVRVVQFPNSFLDNQDTGLKDRLITPDAMRGVLSWAVEGAKRYLAREGGLVTPAPVKKWTHDMRGDQDMVSLFLSEEMVAADKMDEDSFAPLELLMKSYTDWCKGLGIRGKGLPAFRSSLEAKGFKRVRRRHVMYDNARSGFLGIVMEHEPELPLTSEPPPPLQQSTIDGL